MAQINEAKRYVRRYYVKPFNEFCSNKAEVLMALIEHEDEDCTIYTLNNLGDEKDVNKLTSNDVIYYYEDGILYDKNHVRIMDYELSIKHEEERPKINVDSVSDATLADVYADRMTDSTVLEEENEFALDFPVINEEAERHHICCICGEEFDGYGNNPAPVKEDGVCCNECNIKFVIPARLEQVQAEEEEK